MNDLTVFKEALGPALLAIGSRAFGDGIYSPDADVILSKNKFDSEEVGVFFKNRSLSRHEKCNGLLNNFNVLFSVFLHSQADVVQAHWMHFHAVIVLV